jgi:hypothetical protein
MITKTNAVMAVIIIVLLLVAGAALKAWYAERHKPVVSQTEYVPVSKIKQVVKIKRVMVPGPDKIVTIEKEKVVEKLKLPNWVAQNADEQIIATGEIEPWEGKTDVVATLNTKSGAGNIIAKQRPLSLFAFENKKELGGRLGYTSKEFKQIITGFGRWQFLRVGNFHAGLYGEGNTEGEAIGQLELIYRF